MWAFLEKLINISKEIPKTSSGEENKKFGFSITTMALFSGDGALVAKKQLREIGFEILGAINLKMASNVSIPYFHFDPVEQDKLERRKKKAIVDLKDFYNDLINNKKHLEGRWNLLGKLGGWIQRVGMDWALKKYLKYSVDSDLCTKCMFCVNNCPTNNISYNKNKFEFSNKCTYCMRCYNFCPTQAILINDKYCDTKKYKRHNSFLRHFK